MFKNSVMLIITHVSFHQNGISCEGQPSVKKEGKADSLNKAAAYSGLMSERGFRTGNQKPMQFGLTRPVAQLWNFDHHPFYFNIYGLVT